MPGKFEGNADPKLAEWLYQRSMDGWQQEDKGQSDYSGWHCLFLFPPDSLPHAYAEMGLSGLTVQTLQAGYVCTEDSNGFWTCEGFDSAEEARSYYEGKPDFGEDIEPICDICGRSQYDSPNILPDMRQYESDWNEETGNHILCEKDPLNVGETLVDNHGNEYYGEPK